jgi:hypothetical protein
VAWLRAPLDEDEWLARQADVKQGDPDWWVGPAPTAGGEFFTVRSLRDVHPIARVQRLDGDDGEPAAILDGAAAADHIARHDPARVLREVEAKRRIIDLHAPHRDGACPTCWRVAPRSSTREDFPCPTLRLLALPYATEPGYQRAWWP